MMSRIFNLSALRGLSMLIACSLCSLLTFSCEEESFLPADEVLSEAPNELVVEVPDITSAHVIASAPLQQQILKAILPQKGGRSVVQKSRDSLAVQLSRVVSGYAMNVKREDRLENYTYYVPAENPLEIINLVITADGDSLLEGSIFTYQMHPEFAQEFNQFNADFRSFVGTLTVSPLAKLPELYYHGTQKNDDQDGTDCFEWIFSQQPDRPNGGGGGSTTGDGPGPGTITGTIGGPTYTGGSTTCTSVIVEIPCTIVGHEYGTFCSADQHGGTPPIQIEITDCPNTHTGPGQQLQGSDDSNFSKNFDPEDCPQLLSSIGVVARELNYPAVGSRLTEAIEAAVSETCFSLPAVMHIIDRDEFGSCASGGLLNGPSCVTQQIENYLNGLGLGSVPGSPLSFSFSGLPHDQLAAFLNAAVAGEGNEHVYAGIGAVLVNLPLSIDIFQAIYYMSTLHMNVTSEQEYTTILSDLIELFDIVGGELEPDQIIWLTENPDILTALRLKLEDYPDSEDALELSIAVVELIKKDSEIKLERVAELYQLIKDDQHAFFENCAPPSITDWSELASFVPSGPALQRIQNSNGTWEIQFIEDAKGALVNLDYFAVALNELPYHPSQNGPNGPSGPRMTPQEFFDYFRLNINNFAPKFNPYDPSYDTQLWNSNNAEGVVMEIEMQQILGIDFADGDVLCAQHDPCCWIFTTLRGAPLIFGSNNHPVSGNRQFGYTYEDNVFVLYTQGADRTTKWWHGVNNSENAFRAADDFWHNMQENLRNFAVANGGVLNGVADQEEIFRPSWDSVKSLLKLNSPILSVPCN